MLSDSMFSLERHVRDIGAQESGSAAEIPGTTPQLRAPSEQEIEIIEEQIENLEEQIGILEDGLSRAPGMQRAALAKEIAAYRRQLDDRRREREGAGGAA